MSLDIVYKILDELDDLLLPYTIDLSIFDDIHDKDVIEHIKKVGVAFYDKYENTLETALV